MCIHQKDTSIHLELMFMLHYEEMQLSVATPASTSNSEVKHWKSTISVISPK